MQLHLSCGAPFTEFKYNTMKTRILWVFLLTLAAGSLHAQDNTETTPDSSLVELYPVTVIAVRPDQQSQDKVNMGYQERMEHDGAAVLNQLPAISSVKKSGNYGFDPVFRGFKNDQLNIVFNGAQTASAACPNRMDPPTSQMAPNMMEKIEVLKGPYALRYGTGFGATINFVPTPLKFTETREHTGRISLGANSNGNVLRSEVQAGFHHKTYDVNLFMSWSDGTDYIAGTGDTIPADFSRGSFGANAGIKLSDKQTLRVQGMLNIARDADFAALGMDLRDDNTYMLNMRHDYTINGKHLKSWNTTAYGSYVDHLMDNLLKELNPRMMNASTKAMTLNYGGRTEGVWRFGNSKLYTGADYRMETASGIRVREFLMGPMAGMVKEDNAWQDGQINKAGLFAEWHMHSGKNKVVVSSRLEYNNGFVATPHEKFTAIHPETSITQINPSLSVGLQHKLNNETSLALWAGRAQRSASLVERYINFFAVGNDPYELLGNPLLAPEINNQVDLTLKWQGEHQAVTVDLYAAYMQDYITSFIDTSLTPVLPMSPGVRMYDNIDEAFKTGFEVAWSAKLGYGLSQQLGFAYTYAQDLHRNQALPEIPPMDFRYVLKGHYVDGKICPELSIHHALAQNRISEEFGETVTPGFTVVDLKMGYCATDKLVLSVGVNNLMDVAYYEHLSRSVKGTSMRIYAPGRNIFFNLNYKF